MFHFCMSSTWETEHPQKTLAMVCICIFWVCQLEALRLHFLHCQEYLLRTDPQIPSSKKRYPQRGRKLSWIHSWRDSNQGWFRIHLAFKISSQKTVKFRTTYPRRETCLLLRGLSQVLVDTFGKYPVSTDGAPILKLVVSVEAPYSPWEKSLIGEDNAIHHDRPNVLTTTFPCRKKNCDLKHVKQWLDLFAYH